MILFLAGLVVGGFFGLLLMALMTVAKQGDQEDADVRGV